ncbi:motility protein A [Pseudobacteroides cellulosolvens]|uniref:MotA/TolQ/ExbB proton channel n=1 Tax=Pseudobacteroides cellulosolvens ATCC 35603 = DSM 2933 TaxID=398512 RepID=A0A0L6JRP8_9FIRM|nr:MotA/TolQ/ExbB proton channel family protein [Pseudobacteroides cellulosolvens]KNY28516.1 MotA/TolQ/ExbB proton channel [Pseudobacteroides cellulosolvens ATCC 35603 = DSM 2933]
MDIGAIIALAIGFASVLLGYVMEGGTVGALLQKTSAIIVIGGTIGATALTFPLSELKKLFYGFKLIIIEHNYNEVDVILEIAELSEKARKNGLLSLEQYAQGSDGKSVNSLLKKGLALVVDGVEGDVIKDILKRESDLKFRIYESNIKILEAAGGFSPTMGVLGTVMGMVFILGNMGSDTKELAHSIAVAFIATMYGVGLANLVYLPLAGRVRSKAEREVSVNELIIEGLLSIQAGENPRIIKEKLNLQLLEQLNKGKF